MSKDPAFLFYSSDFLTGTTLMSNEQIGKYIRLLCIQHQKGHLCEKDMMKICGSYDEDIFDKFTKDEAGKFYNKRLEEESTKRKNYVESRRKNRLKKTDNIETSEKHMKNISLTYDAHMENENENEDNIKESFLEFWNLYDKKVGDKKKLLIKWKNLSEKDRTAILEYLPKYKQAQPDKKFRKNPETFLNNKSWNDEIISDIKETFDIHYQTAN